MKKKKVVNVILWIFCFLALYRCTNKEMTHLTSEELVWLEAYDTEDTILFQSPMGRVDTMLVLTKNIDNSYWPFVHNENFDDIYYAGGLYAFDVIHGGEDFSGLFILTKLSRKKIELSCSLGKRSTYDDRPIVISCDKLNNIDSIVVDSTNSEIYNTGDVRDTIASFVWSKKEGLKSYSLSNGDTYYLKNKKNKCDK